MDYLPFNLKISYNQRLDIQLFIRHQLNNQKFKRHWIFYKGYDHAEECKLLKNYVGFLNQGDIFRIKTPNLLLKWKEKTLEQNLGVGSTLFSTNLKKRYKLDLKKQMILIEQQVTNKQYDQFFVITIFLSESLQTEQFQEFHQILLGLQNSQFLINIFVPQQFVDKLISSKAWIRTYSFKDIKQQMRGLFGSMNKIDFKKITIKLRCLQGEIIINEKLQTNEKSFWKSQNQAIYNVIYFPSCNSPYIMTVQLKNLMKTQICSFQIQLICQDETGTDARSIKTFSLKPKRQFLDWTDTNSSNTEGLRMSKYQQLSLSFQEVNLNQKLNFMKIYGTPGKALLKSRSEV